MGSAEASLDRIPSERILGQIRTKLLSWFRNNDRRFPWRRSSVTQYQYVIAEILLQRTRAETAARFFPTFVDTFPSWKHISASSIGTLEELLQPLGLWRRRAASIHALANEMSRRNGRFPRSRSEIESLPGVGQYIANAILLFCHNEPEPLLDVNMARVLERVFGSRQLADIRHDPYLQELSHRIVDCQTPNKVNWAILDLAGTTCLIRNPRCERCPLASMCLTRLRGAN